jgi:hypothetical protein
MGLSERRKIKELRERSFPERTRELEEIAGSPIVYEVHWASFENDLEALNSLDNLSCHRTNMALRAICADELGKEAVRDGLKTIKLANVKEKGDMSIAFSGGVLDMACAYALRTEDVSPDSAIRNVLMDGL